MRLLFCKAKREKKKRTSGRQEGREKIYLEQNDQQALRARTPLWSSFDVRAVGTRLIEVIFFFSSVLSIVVRPSPILLLLSLLLLCVQRLSKTSCQ